jgi:hypothetical protein
VLSSSLRQTRRGTVASGQTSRRGSAGTIEGETWQEVKVRLRDESLVGAEANGSQRCTLKQVGHPKADHVGKSSLPRKQKIKLWRFHGYWLT